MALPSDWSSRAESWKTVDTSSLKPTVSMPLPPLPGSLAKALRALLSDMWAPGPWKPSMAKGFPAAEGSMITWSAARFEWRALPPQISAAVEHQSRQCEMPKTVDLSESHGAVSVSVDSRAFIPEVGLALRTAVLAPLRTSTS